MVVAGHVEQVGMEARGVAVALQHHRLGVVEQPLPGGALHPGGAAHQGTAQRVSGELEHQLGPQRARIRQHHQEHPQRALATRDRERADVRPVDLGLLAGERLESQEHLGLGGGTDAANQAAQGDHAAPVAAGPDHVEQPGGAQPRIVLELGGDELAIRIEPQFAGLGRLDWRQ